MPCTPASSSSSITSSCCCASTPSSGRTSTSAPVVVKCADARSISSNTVCMNMVSTDWTITPILIGFFARASMRPARFGR